MKVGSQLEDAQLEISDDAGESTTIGMVKYNSTKESISVGNGTITKRLFPVEGDFGAFRSAMYPVGSMINSFLTDAQFIAEMDDKWVNVNTLPLATNSSKKDHFKIAKSTDLGAYLDAAGAPDDDDSSDYVIWANPTGRYLRAGGNTTNNVGAVTKTNNNGESLDDCMKTHTHSYDRPYDYGQYSVDLESGMVVRIMKIDYSDQTGRSELNRDETRPVSAVCNLFIKVNN